MPPTVLVADRDSVARERAAWCLLARGYRVVVAKNGFEALKALSSNPVDLILFELGLALLEGQDVLRHLAEDPVLRRIPVLTMRSDALTPRIATGGQDRELDGQTLVRAVESILGPGEKLRLRSFAEMSRA